jgi:hypothetical protein
MKSKTFRQITTFFWRCLMCGSLLIAIKLQAHVAAPLSQQSQTNSNQIANQFANIKLTYKIIDAPDKTFGYDIYADDRKLIHQSSIPAIAGNEGFKTKGDAVKVAKLVIDKMKKGEWPPAVTAEELKKLKVII